MPDTTHTHTNSHPLHPHSDRVSQNTRSLKKEPIIRRRPSGRSSIPIPVASSALAFIRLLMPNAYSIRIYLHLMLISSSTPPASRLLTSTSRAPSNKQRAQLMCISYRVIRPKLCLLDVLVQTNNFIAALPAIRNDDASTGLAVFE